MKCPKCNTEVQNQNINIQTDVAQCQNCNNIFKISHYIEPEYGDFDIDNPPKGAWIKTEMHKIILGASTRSPIAFFLVPFMLVWSGGSLGGIYGTQFIKGEFDLIMSLFGIPFIIGSLIFWSLTLMAIWGKVEIVLDKNGGKTFTGIGKIGISKNFNWDDISSISEKQASLRYPGSSGSSISLEGKQRISIGRGLGDSKRYYLFKAIRTVFLKRKANRNYIEEVKIGVVYDIRITHLSIGQTNEQWEKNREEFAQTYSDKLPVRIVRDLDITSPIKVLVSGLFFKNYTGSEMYIYELTKELKKLNCDITVVSDINGPLSKQAKSMGIKILPLTEYPGYKMGDGMWGMNTPKGFQPSQKGMMYKVGNVDFDIIHTQHKPITERVLQLYPNIPKIATIHSEVISLEDPVVDNSILEYVAIRPEIKDKMVNTDGIDESLISVIYNPIDGNRFNTQNTKDDGYILFVGTIDYLRENSIRDIADYAKEQNKELWLVGENSSNYLTELLQQSHIKHFPSTNRVEQYVKNCSETAGILLGRTTIEGWMCGKAGWIYDVDDKGNIKSKERFDIPSDIDKFNSKEVAKTIKELYIKILKQW